MKKFSKMMVAGTMAVVMLPAMSASAQRVAHRSRGRANAAGGVTAARATGIAGTNGGRAVHGRAVATDGAGGVKSVRGIAVSGPNGAKGVRGASNTVSADGTATHKSGSYVQGPNGAYAGRAGNTTVNPDGSATHQSGFKASGAHGTVQSTGTAQRGTDGSVSGERTTTLTGKNGNTYNGTTTWQKGEGAQHTSKCTDPNGNVIPCKK